MNFDWRMTVAVGIVCVSACSGSPSPGPAAAAPTVETPASAGAGGDLTGKVAASLAPPASVVVVEPAGGADLPIKPEPAIMDQAGYEFLPAFLIAQAGQTVQFRNSEDVLHNVRVSDSTTYDPVFNVATLAFGMYEHKFEPGFYTVTCDIHSTMRASILVTATPYTATTGTDGRFAIPNVKPGPYNLTIYTGAQPVVRTIEVKAGGTDLGVVQ